MGVARDPGGSRGGSPAGTLTRPGPVGAPGADFAPARLARNLPAASVPRTLRRPAGHGLPGDRLTVYISEWCPDCRRTKRVLDEAAVPYDEIDIDRDAGAEALVVSRSGGKRIVPTLRFEERIWAFNPEPALLRKLLGKGDKTSH